jgi:hypothetical protein
MELKYSRNTSLNKILLGQLEESHTREQMLQILATMMVEQGDQKIEMESSKNMSLSWGVVIFRERERAGDEEISERPGGHPHHRLARPSLGRTPWW